MGERGEITFEMSEFLFSLQQLFQICRSQHGQVGMSWIVLTLPHISFSLSFSSNKTYEPRTSILFFPLSPLLFLIIPSSIRPLTYRSWTPHAHLVICEFPTINTLKNSEKKFNKSASAESQTRVNWFISTKLIEISRLNFKQQQQARSGIPDCYCD